MTQTDHQEFRQLAERYAQAVDRRNAADLRELLTDTAVIEGPGFRLSGIDEILGIPAMLDARFRTTRHLIHNQVINTDGDAASGETWCTASHLQKDTDELLVWHMRYQEYFSRDGGQWRFQGRIIVIDWTELSQVTLG